MWAVFCTYLRVVPTSLSVGRRYGTNEFHLQLHMQKDENLSINGTQKDDIVKSIQTSLKMKFPIEFL